MSRRISGWRNEGLPSRDASGRTRLSNPPLALNLHYLISAYGSADLHAEILLGYAMQLLHENPVLTRDAIRTALQPSPDVGTTLPPALRALADSGLQDQVEQLSITPEFLSTEEMSKFWTATLAHYRPSAAYEVSVVLIQAEEPAPLPLPVLTRQIAVNPNLLPLVPNITAVVPAGSQPVVQLGTTVTLDRITSRRVQPAVRPDQRSVRDRRIIAGCRGSDATKLLFSIPTRTRRRLPGWRLSRRRARATDRRVGAARTNQLAMTLAPSIDDAAAWPVTRDGAGTATSRSSFTPAVRAGQIVRLVLGTSEFAPQPFAAPAHDAQLRDPERAGRQSPRAAAHRRHRQPDHRSVAVPPVFLNQRIKIQ